jgi:regulator of cell morphogenesis and NO signaling
MPTTTDNNLTLADVAATSLAAVRLLEQHGLDYCCGGKQPFLEACRERNLDPAAILAAIESAGATAPETDWQSAPLRDLANHIIRTHHEYLKLELPTLAKRLEKVLSVHGPKDTALWQPLFDTYSALYAELDQHLHKEEVILFPFIDRYAAAEAAGLPMPPVPFGSLANPIAVMDREHTSAGAALAEIRRLTSNFTLPDYACTTVQNLYAGLLALEADLHTHIHLENNILFPRAIALEQR